MRDSSRRNLRFGARITGDGSVPSCPHDPIRWQPTGFPQSVRDEALELYREVGPAKAARQLGLESGTIRAWAHRAGITSTRVAYEWAEDGRTWPATMAAQDAARLRAQRRELAELTAGSGRFFSRATVASCAFGIPM